MDITLTLTAVEVDTLERMFPGKTLDVALHLSLAPYVKASGEPRLQALADQYRSLTPELQFEGTVVMREWLAGKGLWPPPTAPTA